MNFELPEDLVMLRDAVRRFAAERILPGVLERDESCQFPRDIVRELGEMGVMGVRTPEQYGGAGLGSLALALVVEEVARHDGSLALTVASHNGLCSGHILLAGNHAQKEKYLTKLTTAEWLGAWGLTEPSSGSDAANMSTVAEKVGDGWRINGSKVFITQGSVGDVYVILAVTDREKKQRGVTAFIAERGWEGLGSRALHGKLGMHSSDTAELFFENLFVPDENVLGEVGGGFLDTLKILDRGRITIAALGLGVLRGAMEQAGAYALERNAFGSPIARFQAIQWMLADMAVDYERCRLLTHRAAALCDAGEDINLAAAMAKLSSAQAAVKAATNAIQIHGGYGYTCEYHVERYLRDAKLLEIGEGTNEIQRLVISRRLLRG